MGITNEESIKNPEKEQEIKNKINLNKIPAKKSKTIKTVKINNKPRTKMITSTSLKNGNKLSFNKLLKNCPEIKSKIIKSSSIDTNNYITRPTPKKVNMKHKHYELNLEEDKHYSKIKTMTSLLESDSDDSNYSNSNYSGSDDSELNESGSDDSELNESGSDDSELNESGSDEY
jgi:5-hydroxyisourate hydrolase-like protein (transthyretin family)